MGMQRYNYKGQSYNLPDTYTPEEALSKIKEHLGESSVAPKTEPVGYTEAIKRGLSEAGTGVMNAFDLMAGGLASAVGSSDSDKIFSNMDKRIAEQQAAREAQAQEQYAPGGRIVQAVAGGLPQMITSHASQAAEDVNQGASTGQALAGLGIDTAANLVNLALPGGKGIIKGAAVGGASNLATDVITDTLKRKVYQGSDIQKKYTRNAEDYLTSAAVGAAMGGTIGGLTNRKKTPQVNVDKLEKAKELQAARQPVQETVPGSAAGETPGTVDLEYMQQRRLQELQDNAKAELQQKAELEKQQTLNDYHKQAMDAKRVQTEKLMEDLDNQQAEATRVGDLEKAAELENHQRLLEQEQQKQQLDLGYNSEGGRNITRTPVTDSGLMGLPEPAKHDPFGSVGNQNKFVPKGQRGGVDFDGVLKSLGSAKQKIKDVWNKIPGHEDTVESSLAKYPDENVTLEALKAQAGTLDDNVVRGQTFKSGSSQMAIFSRNPVVKATADYMQTAYKRADKAILDFVKPVEHTFQKMAWTNKKELTELASLFKEEMFARTPFEISDLQGAGYSEKQIKMYQQLRTMFDKAYEAQNKMLEANNMPTLSKHEYYTASRWDGDWKSHVYDTDGKLVWVIKDRSKAGVKRALDYLEANGIPVDRDKSQINYSRMSHDVPSNMPAAYSAMLQHITEGNPLAQKAREVMDAKMMAEAHRTLGQSKHFETKANIRGFVGDRPWMDPFDDAKDMFSQQFQYAKNAFQWSEYNQAASKMKIILDDPTIAKEAPQSVESAKRIVDHYLGSSDRNLMAKVENAVAKGTGHSVQDARDILGMAKTGWILQKMGTNTGALLQNLFQPVNTIPFHTMLSEEGFKHNPVKTMLATTMDTAAAMAEHYGKKLGANIKTVGTPIGKAATKYAEDNGILNLSAFDEHTNINSTRLQVGIQKTLGVMVIEADKVSKFSAFMSYVHHLQQSGKHKNNMELFRDAEHYMNASMVDPRMQERPFIIQDTGLAGNLASTLQGYTANYLNQLASFSHRAFVEKKPAALIEFLGISGALAGLAGTTGVNGVIAAHDVYRQWVAENKPEDYDKTSDWRKWFVDLDDGSFIGQAAKYGVPSALTGADLSQKFEAQVSIPGIGPVADVGKQVGSFANAIATGSPDAMKSAIYKSAPAGVAQGTLDADSGWFQDPKTGKYAPPSSRDYSRGYFRDDEDKLLRRLGVVSTKESKEKELIYLQKRDELNNNTVNKNLLSKSVDVWMKGKEDNPFFNALIKRNPEISQAAIGGAIDKYVIDHGLNAQQAAWLKAKAWASVKRNMEYQR